MLRGAALYWVWWLVGKRDAVDFRIFGPLYVSREGRPLRLGGHQQKMLVCLLLLHANEVVSAERIIDAL
jgi:DNA-binding SARP family transcriptional activator